MSKIHEALREVISAHYGEIGTHYEGCWKYHVGCLAVLAEDLLDEYQETVRSEAYGDGYSDGRGDGYDEGYDSGYETGAEAR